MLERDPPTNVAIDSSSYARGVSVVSDAEAERLLDHVRLIDDLAEGFMALSRGEVVAPPRIVAMLPDGQRVGVLTGYWAPAGFVTKTYFVRTTRKIDEPTVRAHLTLHDVQSGAITTVMNAAHLTLARTAATSALATRLLAKSTTTMAVLGAGRQAAAHVSLFKDVFRLHEVRIASRSLESAQALARRYPGAVAMPTIESAVTGADIVVSCTSSGEPILDLAWLTPGVHVTSVGAVPPRGELPSGLLEVARVFVEDTSAVMPHPTGAPDLQGIAPESVVTLGDVLLGRRSGRTGDEEITVFKSVGHVIEDLVASRFVQRALLLGTA